MNEDIVRQWSNQKPLETPSGFVISCKCLEVLSASVAGVFTRGNFIDLDPHCFRNLATSVGKINKGRQPTELLDSKNLSKPPRKFRAALSLLTISRRMFRRVSGYNHRHGC